MNLESDSLRRAFESDGYVAVPGFLSAAEMAELNSNMERYIRDIVPALPPEHKFYEDKKRPDTLKQLQVLYENDSYFADQLFEGPFARLAQQLLNDRVVRKNLQYFNKPPSVGQPTPAHQDGYYFNLDPPVAVTMWLALDAVDEENGCMRYVRGSHRRGMRLHGRTDVLGFSQGITDYGQSEDLADEVAFPAQPGDLLVHHALTIHRADGNRSATRTRRSLGFIYYAESSKEDVATTTQYLKQLKQELLAAEKI